MEAIVAALAEFLGNAELQRLRRRLDVGQEADLLTDYERLAIWVYTTALGHHDRINGELWNPGRDASARRVADLLESAIRKLPSFVGPVYRGVTVADAEAYLESTCRIGAAIVWPAFTSTTSVVDLIFPGNVRFLIHSRTGRRLGGYSSAIEECEVLFPPRTRFVVVGWKRTASNVYVELQEQVR